MEIRLENGAHYLVEKGGRIPLSPDEINLMRRLKPMGRKIVLRKRAVDSLKSNPHDSTAMTLLELTKLPVKDWGFRVPD